MKETINDRQVINRDNESEFNSVIIQSGLLQQGNVDKLSYRLKLDSMSLSN